MPDSEDDFGGAKGLDATGRALYHKLKRYLVSVGEWQQVDALLLNQACATHQRMRTYPLGYPLPTVDRHRAPRVPVHHGGINPHRPSGA